MATLKDAPLRIPDQWSATWFRQFVVEVLAKADARAITGDVTVTSDGNSVANVSISDTVLQEVVLHNADPFSHSNAFAAHVSETDPHTGYVLEANADGLDYVRRNETWVTYQTPIVLNDDGTILLNNGTALMGNA